MGGLRSLSDSMNCLEVFTEMKRWTEKKTWKLRVILYAFLLVGASFTTIKADDWPPLDAKVSQSVEALKRLKHLDIRSNAALNKVLLQTLEKVKERPEFVQLVIAFGLTDQNEALLTFIREHPESSAGLSALDYIVKSSQPSLLDQALGDKEMAPLLSILGELPHSQAAELLLKFATNKKHTIEDRKTAIRSLCRTKTGVHVLLSFELEHGIPEDLKLTAAYAFNQIPWPKIKAEALELIPLPLVKGDTSLPSIDALTQQQGNIANGKAVFLRLESGCAMCHQIGDKGVDFGPGLTEIGDKLGKDALYQSILDPNGGISFGFEGWEVLMKSGEEWTGIVIGETESSITLKNQSGLLLILENAAIESRSQMKSSLMPAGLQQAMTVKDLVDLVEYLSSLKKRP